MSNRFELPSINVEQRSNEQNMQSVKSYLTDLPSVYLILFNFNIILCHAFPITAEHLRKRARKCAKTAFTTHKSVNGAE